MRYVDLFKGTADPVRASQIVLGCDNFGFDVSEDTAFAIMDAYCEKGGDVLDTARIYGLKESGETTSEVTVGKWLKSRGMEKKLTVVSKGAHPDRRTMNVSRLNQNEITGDLHKSLDALKTDCIDIWLLHRDNPDMPAGEIIDIVSEFVDKGLVKHLGVSNWTGKRLSQAAEYAKKHGKHRFEISQIQWSLPVATPESWDDPTIVCMNDEQYKWYSDNKMPLMAFASQGRGIVSKVIENGPESVSEKTRRYFMLEKNMPRISKCRELCQEKGVNPAGVCLSYIIGAPFPAFPILGCKTLEHINDSLRHADIQLSETERRELEI